MKLEKSTSFIIVYVIGQEEEHTPDVILSLVSARIPCFVCLPFLFLQLWFAVLERTIKTTLTCPLVLILEANQSRSFTCLIDSAGSFHWNVWNRLL